MCFRIQSGFHTVAPGCICLDSLKTGSLYDVSASMWSFCTDYPLLVTLLMYIAQVLHIFLEAEAPLGSNLQWQQLQPMHGSLLEGVARLPKQLFGESPAVTPWPHLVTTLQHMPTCCIPVCCNMTTHSICGHAACSDGAIWKQHTRQRSCRQQNNFAANLGKGCRSEHVTDTDHMICETAWPVNILCLQGRTQQPHPLPRQLKTPSTLQTCCGDSRS